MSHAIRPGRSAPQDSEIGASTGETNCRTGNDVIFSKKLQELTAKINAADDIDEILRDISQDICDALEAERLTIYLANEDKTLIVSKIKTGLESHDDLKLLIL